MYKGNDKIMEGINAEYTLSINDSVYKEALAQADAEGISLSSIIEGFLVKWTREKATDKKKANIKISEEVRSLTTRLPYPITDLDCDKLKDDYFKQKYKL